MSELSNQIRYASQKRVLIEVALIKLCRPDMETNYDSILDRIRVLEKKLEQGVPVQVIPQVGQQEMAQSAAPQAEETAQVLQQAVPEDLQQVAKNWDRICGLLSGSVRALLREAMPSVGEGNSLLLVFHNDIHYGMFDSEDHIAELKDAIERQIQKEIQIKLQLVNPNETKRDDLPDLSKLSKMTIEFED